MRASSGGWDGVIPHALSKEKTEEKKKISQRKEKTEGQGTNHLGWRWRDVSKKSVMMSQIESGEGEVYLRGCISNAYKG